MKTKVIAIFLVAAMLISFLPIGSSAASASGYEPYALIETGYSQSVNCGTVRYMSQTSSSRYFNSAYWGSWASQAGIECGTASISMSLSYIGVNKTPKDILDAGNGLTYFGWTWGDGVPKSYTATSLTTAVENYINGGGKYSPPIIHLNNYSSAGHFVAIVGRVSSNTYQVIDPGNSVVTWQITINGTNASYSHPSTGKTINDSIDQSGRSDDIYQYYNANASLKHDCDKGTYKWYWDAHPHYKDYACSICGKVNTFYDETVALNTCESCRPGKPVLNVAINDDGVATFTWNETANTTHYNVWLAKKNAGGDWESIEQVFEAESGFQRTFEEGEYQAQLLSYSSKMWEPDGSDWVHTWGEDVYFSVVDECRHNYTSKHVDATCVDYGYTTYTCSLCGDTYTMYDGDYTEWSTTKPSGVDEELIDTKPQYRYADKETTTSYESSLSGWTQVGGEWQQSGTGSVTYV